MNRTFRSFIQGLSGGSRELPLQPKPHRGHAGVSVALLGVAWFAALFILGFLSQIVGYQATVASDIARDRIREVVPDAAPIQSTNYRGRAFPYEFTLDSEWKPTAIPPGADRTEYLFEFRGGLGKLEIMSNAGIKLIDLHLDSFPSGVRESIETAVRKEVPTATIKLVGSRWVTINGIDWREVRLEQHYSPTASEMKRLLFYSRPSGWVTVTILMPNQTHYEKIIDDIVATIRLSADDQDRLLRESRTGAPVVYRGKHIKYELPLSAIWKTEDMEKKLEEMGEAGQKLKAMDSGREYTFELAGGKLAALDVEVGDQRFVPAEFRKFVDEFIENQKNVLKDVFPDLDVRLDGLNLRIFKRTAQEWGEFEAQMTLTKDNETNTMSTIHRVTNREGHLLLMSARIHQNDPVILRLATEALDAIRFDQ